VIGFKDGLNIPGLKFYSMAPFPAFSLTIPLLFIHWKKKGSSTSCRDLHVVFRKIKTNGAVLVLNQNFFVRFAKKWMVSC